MPSARIEANGSHAYTGAFGRVFSALVAAFVLMFRLTLAPALGTKLFCEKLQLASAGRPEQVSVTARSKLLKVAATFSGNVAVWPAATMVCGAWLAIAKSETCSE